MRSEPGTRISAVERGRVKESIGTCSTVIVLVTGIGRGKGGIELTG